MFHHFILLIIEVKHFHHNILVQIQGLRLLMKQNEVSHCLGC